MASALIGAGSSLLGGITGGKAAEKAAKIQAQSQAAALAQQQQQFATTQANFSPFIQAGAGALGGQQTLLGLNGAPAQQSAITNLQQSPLYTSQYGAGLDAINQNAAATGGLRGGNTALAQSNFGAGLLGSVFQQQLAGLGGLSSMGVNAAGNAGRLGQDGSNAISQIYGNQGNIGAANSMLQGSILGRTGADITTILQNSLAKNALGSSNSGDTSLGLGINGMTSGLLDSSNAGFANGLRGQGLW